MKLLVALLVCLLCTLSLPAQNVGIGVTDPTCRLDILTPNINSTVGRFMSGGGFGEIQIGNGTKSLYLGANTSGAFIASPPGDPIFFRNGGSVKMTLIPAGFLGIGTETPNFRFDVQAPGASSTVARFKTTGGVADILIENGAQQLKLGVNDTSAYVRAASGHDLRLQTGSTDRVYIDHSSGYVGINTHLPEFRLDTRASVSNSTIARFKSLGGVADIFIENGTQQVKLGVNNNGGVLRTVTGHNLYLQTGSQNRLFIEHATGFTGINTITPEYRLDTYAGGADSTIARFKAPGGFGDILIENNEQQLKLGVSPEGGFVQTLSGDDLILKTDTQTRVMIKDDSGNVGIGTTQPQHTLDVAGDLGVDSLVIGQISDQELMTLESGLSIVEQQIGNQFYSTSSEGWQSFVAPDNGQALRASICTYGSAAITQIKIFAGEGTAGEEIAERMVMPSGAGWHDFPLLDIDIDSGSVYTLWINNRNQVRYTNQNPYVHGRSASGSSDDLVFRIAVSAATPFIVNGTSPHRLVLPDRSSRLDVGGSVHSPQIHALQVLNIGGSELSGLPVNIKMGNSTDWIGLHDYSGNQQWRLRGVGGDGFGLSTSTLSNYVFVARQNGNIGFGTINPENRLDAQVSASDVTVAKFSTTGGRSDVRIQNGVQALNVGVDLVGGFIRTSTPHDLRFQTNTTDRLTIDHDNGHIGIGTTSPVSRLDVQSQVPSSIVARFASAGDYGEIHAGNGMHTSSIGANTSGCFIGTYTNSDLRVRTNNTVRLIVRHASGFVGIGTENPNSRLHVDGNIELSGHLVIEPLVPVVYQNGWGDYGFGYGNPAYYKDKQKRVYLSGLAGHAGTINGVIYTLPVGYRPLADIRLHLPSDDPEGWCVVSIDASTGEVVLNNSDDIVHWISFDNVSFRTN